MKCRQYIFLLTSDQLPDVGPVLRLQARWHHLICGNCRVFTKKDAALMQAVKAQCQADKAALIPLYIS